MNKQVNYAAWRFSYWLNTDMTYAEIDEAVRNGKIKVGDMPDKKNDEGNETCTTS